MIELLAIGLALIAVIIFVVCLAALLDMEKDGYAD